MTFKSTKFLAMALGAALAAGGGLAQAQSSIEIDFSSTTGYGLDTDLINIENIRVDIVVTNPFDPTRPTISSNDYTVPFRFDSSTLHLVPDLGATVDESDTTTACASLSLNITDAYTGSVVSGASVSVGSNSDLSDSSGGANFTGLREGSVQVEVVADGYNSTQQVVDLSCADPTDIGIALNPESGSEGGLSANEVRVILSWGENPRDLDSHLTGPDANSDGSTSDETNRFHIYYSNRSVDAANLDRDDVSSYGPETITITPPEGSSVLRDGLYRYSVYHFSGSNTLATSDATVRLVFDDGDERSFTPPADDGTLTGSGDLWTVFELLVSGGSVTVLPVNTYSDVTGGSSSIRSTATGYGEVESGVDFARLPAK